jgi:predicted Zn-dependent protease
MVVQVRTVGMRIAAASGLTGVDWAFHVVRSREKNAFVLPGGKVFVFSGPSDCAREKNAHRGRPKRERERDRYIYIYIYI